MAYDGEAGGDPRGPWCPKCSRPIRVGETWTIMHFAEDPDGALGLGGRRWHSECARPHWDKMSGLLQSFKMMGRF